jgi:hypothetical protein
VTVDRLQSTLTVTFHYLFPVLTMGLALFVAWLKKVSYLGREQHRRAPLRNTQEHPVHAEPTMPLAEQEREHPDRVLWCVAALRRRRRLRQAM